MTFCREDYLRIGSVCESGTGVPPVNHAQDARAHFRREFCLTFRSAKRTFRGKSKSASQNFGSVAAEKVFRPQSAKASSGLKLVCQGKTKCFVRIAAQPI